MRSTPLVLALLAWAPALAHADVVVLKDGERVEGIVAERGPEVEVRLDFGTITFQKAEIERIERGGTALSELEAKRAALAPREVEGRYRLALEAEKQGLDALARVLHREVIELSVDHKGARAALGYRRHEGAWMTEDEYMTGQGYTRYRGAWVTREAAFALEKAESDQRIAELEARRRADETSRIQRLEADVAAARAEAAAAAARASAAESEASGAGYGWGAYGGVWAPYWNGTRWDHKQSTPPAGWGVGINVTGKSGNVRFHGGASQPQPQASPRPWSKAQPQARPR